MKRASKLRRRVLIAAALVGLYTVAGFWLLPPIVKSQLERRLSAELGRRVAVGRVALNPYALSARIDELAIHEADGTRVFLGWRSLYANFDALRSLRGEWVLSEITLDGFDVRVAFDAKRTANFADVLDRLSRPAAPPAAPAQPGRPLRVGNLKVSDARFEYSDLSRTQPFNTVLGPVTFSLTDFHTSREVGAPYHFEAATEAGERLVWTGTLQAQPLLSQGELRLENIALPKYAPFYAEFIGADIDRGVLGVLGRYEVALVPGQNVIKLTDGSVHLKDLRVLERATRAPAFELPALEIKGIHADAIANRAVIDTVALTGGHLRARREKDGSTNLEAMLRSASAPAATGPAIPTQGTRATQPEVTLRQLSLQEFQVDIADQALPRPVALSLQGLQVTVGNVSLAPGTQMPLHVAGKIGSKGQFSVDGDVGLSPLIADLKLAANGIEILPVSPYLEQFVAARFSQGEVTATLGAQALSTDAGKLAASVTGDITVDNLGLVDAAQNGELTGFTQLILRGLRASTAAGQGVAVDEVQLVQPYARAVVDRERRLNFASLMRPAPPPAPTAAAGPATPTPRVEIGKFTISGGDFRFTDRSVSPAVNLALNAFDGSVAGLSSAADSTATVDLKGKVDGVGPVAITGKINPLAPAKSANLKVDFKNVDLLPLSPYSAKYAGFELARGKLLFDFGVVLAGNQIDATNVITLNQFTFGRPSNSPDATSLPVRLGVALLKDREGRIVIDAPVHGNLNDPSFSVGRVVLRVIVNLLTKAATSPFALLGAAFGGGGDELAFQEFAAGLAVLQPTEIKKLETLARAMKNRPALNLALEGTYDTDADTEALKRVKLDERVRRAVWESRRQRDPNLAPPAQLEISAEEAAAMLKKLFDEEFPPGTTFGTPIPPPPTPVTPPPAPTGFFAQFIDALTGRSRREEQAAREENARRFESHAKAMAAALASGPPEQDMRQRLAEATPIEESDLHALAAARAQRVRDYLVSTGGIEPDRIFLAQEGKPRPAQGKGPRVFLSLQ